VTGLRKDGYVCVTSCNGEGYFVTCSARLVEACEKSYWGRSWFSPWLGSRCFHIKIVYSHFSIYFRCFTVSEHFTNSPFKQGLSLFSEIAKICQYNSPPVLCLYTLKFNTNTQLTLASDSFLLLNNLLIPHIANETQGRPCQGTFALKGTSHSTSSYSILR